MGDVADILGLGSQPSSNTLLDEANKILNDKPRGLNAGPKATRKPKGMSREVFSLLGADGLVPSVQGNKQVVSGFKSKRATVRGKWLWAPFTNSARGDEMVSYHWVKADIQYSDYPYAKFNVSVDPVTFTDEEYSSLLVSKGWTKEETLHVLDLAAKYNMRWPVIVDRYELTPYKCSEDIQARFYTVVSRLRESRLGLGSSVGSIPNIDVAKDDHQLVFNLEQEKRRKFQLEIAYRKSRDEEVEEQQLREELKSLDALLKKAKKLAKSAAQPAAQTQATFSFNPKDASAGRDAPVSGVSHSQSSSEAASHPSLFVESSSSAVVYPDDEPPHDVHVYHPAPGKPYLQSARLIVTESALNIPKTYTKKLNALLQDLGAPEHPLPTKAVCDLYDQVRLDACTLVALQASISRKERELASYRAVEKSFGGLESFARDVTLPQSSLMYKLPADSLADKASHATKPPSSPSRPPILSHHDYGDLVSTLGVALLAADPYIPSNDNDGSVLGSAVPSQASQQQGKKVVKRKSGGAEAAPDGQAAAKKQQTKKPRPTKPKSEGGMDSAAIAAAAASMLLAAQSAAEVTTPSEPVLDTTRNV